ncbi:MAG: hypothetical protein K9M15_01830, partial [Candidatus Marinimicrobia bacterium]|nr:hypothetical protein [Candidatus Neomarinimicrobiota bacterium]
MPQCVVVSLMHRKYILITAIILSLISVTTAEASFDYQTIITKVNQLQETNSKIGIKIGDTANQIIQKIENIILSKVSNISIPSFSVAPVIQKSSVIVNNVSDVIYNKSVFVLETSENIFGKIINGFRTTTQLTRSHLIEGGTTSSKEFKDTFKDAKNEFITIENQIVATTNRVVSANISKFKNLKNQTKEETKKLTNSISELNPLSSDDPKLRNVLPACRQAWVIGREYIESSITKAKQKLTSLKNTKIQIEPPTQLASIFSTVKDSWLNAPQNIKEVIEELLNKKSTTEFVITQPVINTKETLETEIETVKTPDV